MQTVKVTELSHLSAHPKVPVVVTCAGHALKIAVPTTPPKS